VPSAGIAFGLIELLLGVGLMAASQRMSRQAHDAGDLLLAVHLALQVLGIVLALYGLLRLVFALV